MTSQAKIGAGIVIAVLVIAGGYYSYRKDGVAEVPLTETTASGTPSGKKMAFSQLVQQGGTYKCTVNQNVGNIVTQGIVYMDKGLVRGDFSANYSGQKVDVTFLMRDGYTYVWNSMTPTQGVKIKNNTSIQTGATSTDASPDEYLSQIGDYNCEEWATNASTFTLPTTVTFKAIN